MTEANKNEIEKNQDQLKTNDDNSMQVIITEDDPQLETVVVEV